jgi:hypothetical protein
MLATLEHISNREPVARDCYRLLQAGGRVLVTVPCPAADGILFLLQSLGLIDGMALDEHHGFDPDQTASLFTRHGFGLEYAAHFELWFNHLFVFRKPFYARGGNPRAHLPLGLNLESTLSHGIPPSARGSS